MNERHGENLERWLANDSRTGAPEKFESDLLADADLAEEAYSSLELEAELRTAAVSARRIVVAPRWAWAGGLMAALLAFFILMPQGQDDINDLPLRLRSAGDAGAAVGIFPSGDRDDFPQQFVWHPSVSAADSRYRWELYDGQARRRAVAVVADTVLVRPPAETPDDSTGSWLWLIVELLPDGREGATSAALEFNVKPKVQE